MSEEQVKTEKTCNKSVFALVVLFSFLFSIASLVMSTMNTIHIQGSKPIKISKKYDRGNKTLDRAEKIAKEKGKPILAFFYVDWCRYCQKFAPTFDKLTKNGAIKKHFTTAYINCEAEENRPIADKFGIRAFPTVFVIRPDDSKKMIDNGLLFDENAQKELAQSIIKIEESGEKDIIEAREERRPEEDRGPRPPRK